MSRDLYLLKTASLELITWNYTKGEILETRGKSMNISKNQRYLVGRVNKSEKRVCNIISAKL